MVADEIRLICYQSLLVSVMYRSLAKTAPIGDGSSSALLLNDAVKSPKSGNTVLFKLTATITVSERSFTEFIEGHQRLVIASAGSCTLLPQYSPNEQI